MKKRPKPKKYTKFIMVRLTPKQYAHVKKQADSMGYPAGVSCWVRYKIGVE